MKKNLIIILICLFSWHIAQAESAKVKSLVITSQGVGLINKSTKLNQKTIAKALPGYEITKQIEKKFGKQLKYFKLQRNGKTQIIIYPNPKTKKVSSIHIFDNKAVAPNEIKLGAIYSKVFENDEQANCQAGLDAKSVQTFCSFSDVSNIQYIFELKKSEGGKIILPSEALTQAKLVKIVWFAKKTRVKLKPTSTTLNTTLTDSKKVTPKTTVMKSMAVVPVNIKMAYEAQEKRLNRAYSSFNIILVKLQTTSANTNESDKLNDFINAQRAWKKYLNDNCHWHFTLTNDKETMEHQKIVCLERMTRERADEIEQTLKQISK